MNVLEMRGLRKSFGKNQVLKGVDLQVQEHHIFGFIGKNGAGKTTSMKAALGLLKPDQGEVLVCGEQVKYGNSRTNRQVGYLPDVPEYYGYMTPEEYLELCGKIAGMSREAIRKRSRELLEITGLSGQGRRKIGGFSRGMKQRLGIAQALLPKPRLLICDEPTSALDPAGRKEILELLLQAKEESTVLFSTHILPDVEKICDEIAVLDKGKIVLSGNLEDLREKYAKDALLVECYTAEELEALLSGLSCIRAERTGERSAKLWAKNRAEAQRKLLGFLLKNAMEVQKIQAEEPSLEKLFLEVTE